ncbi:MAG: PepSY domain-containing protein [Pseudomonadota bacterium]
MKRFRSFMAGLATALALASLGVFPVSAAAHDTSAFAQDPERSAQGEARKEMKAGNQLSLRQIERRILPQMRGSEYLGPAYDATAHAYRLKFIKDGRVTYIDVDARSGRIIARSR